MKRHGVPATITSTGRISQAFVPGSAEALSGLPRLVEVYRRFRREQRTGDSGNG